MAVLSMTPAALALSMILALLLTGSSQGLVNPTSSDDQWMSSLVGLVEFDYEDRCVARAEAEWALLNGRKTAFEDKMEVEKSFGDFARSQADEVKGAKSEPHADALLKRKIQLIANPGDTLLETNQWNKLVTFTQTIRNDFESATDYDCKVDKPKNCTFPELQAVMATSRDHHLLVSAKTSWERKLPDDIKYTTEILPLLKNASRVNGFENVEDYWEMLSESPGAYSHAKELWDEIEPLYLKLQKYAALRLNPADGSIPAHLLGSLLGDDWSNIADVVLPYQLLQNEILKNLQEKHIGGREAFKVASRLLVTLGLGDLKEIFWRDSVFDRTCPVRLVDFCQSGNVQAFTCNEVNLPNYLSAHEAAMTVKHAEMTALLMANSHIIREANRYSAISEALAGLASLLAISPKQLDRSGVLPLKVYQQPSNQHKNVLTLQLYTALRDLPRLAYYIDADLWRLSLLAKNPLPEHLGSSWVYWRRNHSFVAPSDKDFLGDPYIVSNKPYVSKFLGGIMKYQLRDALIEDLYDIDGDVVQHISLNNNKLKNILSKGFNKEWPALLDETFQINVVNSQPLLDYFQPLSDFLDTELEQPGTNHDPDAESYFNPNVDEDQDQDIIDNDLDVVEEDNKNDPDENYVEANVPELQNVEQKQPSADTHESEKLAKQSTQEQPTANSAGNSQLIPKGSSTDQKSSSQLNHNSEEVKSSSSLNYAWIALGLLLAIALILVIVIGRKRYNHRKDLERQRREGVTAA